MAKPVAKKPTKKPEAPPPSIAEPQSHGPAATITRRASDRLRAGHLWVYRSDIISLTPPPGTAEVAPGALITIADNRGIPLGTAIYSSASQIAARIVSGEAAQTRPAYLQQVRMRIEAALTLREALAPESPENNASRLIFSEADALPGIIADRYNDLVILQLLAQGTAQDDVRKVFVEVIGERLAPATIVERPDPKIRELEQLAAPSPTPLYSATGEPQLTTVFTINGLGFHYDASAGQKTGAFLELVYVPTLTKASINRKAQFSIADVANTIHQVGPESVILSTDLGQVGFPPPPEGLATYIEELRAQGITQRELDRMTKENPARLLGLPLL